MPGMCYLNMTVLCIMCYFPKYSLLPFLVPMAQTTCWHTFISLTYTSLVGDRERPSYAYKSRGGASIPHSSSAGETTEEFPFSVRTWKSSKSSGTLLLFKWILSRRFKLTPLKLDVPLCALPERSIFS